MTRDNTYLSSVVLHDKLGDLSRYNLAVGDLWLQNHEEFFQVPTFKEVLPATDKQPQRRDPQLAHLKDKK